jgi:two-component SAPR family response regulator
MLATIIVDSDYHSLKILNTLFSREKNTLVIGTFGSVEKAFSFIKKYVPRILVIDVYNLENINRYTWEQINQSPYKPYVILTAFYPDEHMKNLLQYAGDYLLKPLSPEDIKKSVYRYLKSNDLQIFV